MVGGLEIVQEVPGDRHEATVSSLMDPKGVPYIYSC